MKTQGRPIKTVDMSQVIIDTEAQTAVIPLAGTKFTALVSLSDLDKVKKYNWSLHKSGYVATRINTKYVMLHRYLFKCPEGFELDHIDRNKRNNCSSNIRVVTRSENMRNRNLRKDNECGVTGVYKSNIRERWIARIMHEGRNKYLGCFVSIDLAIQARKNAEQELWGGVIHNG
jgi:hypothetical protein